MNSLPVAAAAAAAAFDTLVVTVGKAVSPA